MTDDKHDEQADAVPLPDKVKLFEELHSEMQRELKCASPTAPSYEEAMVCSYPVLPVESSTMHRVQQPSYQSAPYSSALTSQPHSGNERILFHPIFTIKR